MAFVQDIESNGYRARADRRFQTARVLDTDPVSREALLDVGVTLPDGTPVYLHAVPYSPQMPPKPGDTAHILYTNSSPHSVVLGGMQVGANAATQNFSNGGVTALHKSGDPALVDDVTLSEGANVTLTQVGQNIEIAASGGGSVSPASTVTDVAAAGVVGTGVLYARNDHVHKGVHSFAKHAGTQLFGDVTLAEGTNVTLGVSGNEITINAAGSSGVSTKVNGAGAAGPRSTLNFIPGVGVSLSAVDNPPNIDVSIGITSGVANNGQLETAGYQHTGIQPVGGITDLLYGQYVLNTGTASGQSLNLPGLNSAARVRLCRITLFNDSDYNYTINSATGGETINGAASVILVRGQCLDLIGYQDTGTNSDGIWRIVNRQNTVLPVTVTGTTYTLVLTDAGNALECGNASGCTVTVPPFASVPFPIGTEITIANTSAVLNTTLAAGAGVTLQSNVGLVTTGQFSTLRIRKRSTNTWIVTY